MSWIAALRPSFPLQGSHSHGMAEAFGGSIRLTRFLLRLCTLLLALLVVLRIAPAAPQRLMQRRIDLILDYPATSILSRYVALLQKLCPHDHGTTTAGETALHVNGLPARCIEGSLVLEAYLVSNYCPVISFATS
jgi:hypothetical protein